MITAVAVVALAALVVGGTLAFTGGSDNGEEHVMANGETMTGSMTGAETNAAAGAPFDRAFIDAMVPHHQAAIEMAKAARNAGLTQPELVGIADAIVINQQDEIDQMKRWRAQWFGSAKIDPAGAAALGLSSREMGMEHDASMLAAAADVDAEFARMMIDHHEGAVRMARLGVSRGEHSEVRALAREIIAAQEREIRVMKKHTASHANH